MSRRESRASLSNRQNDALQEFEAFKRKFLQYNKQIAKVNSQLQVKIEELNVQISKQTVENFTLQARIISLDRALKKERATNQQRWDNQAVLATDAAAASMIKQLEALRSSFKQFTAAPTPSPTSVGVSPPTPAARSRPSISNRTNLIARAPEISFIQEGDSEEDCGPARHQMELTESNERYSSPLSSGALTASSSPSAHPLNSSRRKPTRRRSGMLPPVRMRSSSPPPAPEELGGSDADDIAVATEGDEDELLLASTVAPAKPSRRSKSKTESELTSKAREKAKGPFGLVDVTNSPPRRQPLEKNILSVLTEESGDEHTSTKSSTTVRAARNRATPREPSPKTFTFTPDTPQPSCQPSPLPDTPASVMLTDSAAGRATRVRKSVNYAEPKLNTKMRKPEEPMPASALLSATPFYTSADYVSSSSSSFQQGLLHRPVKPLPSSLSGSRKPASDGGLNQPYDMGVKIANTASVPTPLSAAMGDDDDEAQVERDIVGSDDSDDEAEVRKRKRGSSLSSLVGPLSKGKPLSSGSDETKSAGPSTRPNSSDGDDQRKNQPIASSSTTQKHRSSASLSSLPVARKPFVPTSKTTQPPPAPSAPTTSTLIEPIPRRRSVIPVHYRYEDISDDDDTVMIDDEEYVEPANARARRKTVASEGGSSRTKSKTFNSSDDTKDRRHSTAV